MVLYDTSISSQKHDRVINMTKRFWRFITCKSNYFSLFIDPLNTVSEFRVISEIFFHSEKEFENYENIYVAEMISRWFLLIFTTLSRQKFESYLRYQTSLLWLCFVFRFCVRLANGMRKTIVTKRGSFADFLFGVMNWNGCRISTCMFSMLTPLLVCSRVKQSLWSTKPFQKESISFWLFAFKRVSFSACLFATKKTDEHFGFQLLLQTWSQPNFCDGLTISLNILFEECSSTDQSSLTSYIFPHRWIHFYFNGSEISWIPPACTKTPNYDDDMSISNKAPEVIFYLRKRELALSLIMVAHYKSVIVVSKEAK